MKNKKASVLLFGCGLPLKVKVTELGVYLLLPKEVVAGEIDCTSLALFCIV